MDLNLAGVIGGLVGGVAFGVMMGKMDMLPMVAKLWKRDSESASFGFFVHLVNSAIIGWLYVLVAPTLGAILTEYGSGATAGLIYGAAWWAIGPLFVMPLWLGMPIQLSGPSIKEKMPSLMGHLVYGLLLGLTVAWLL